MDKFIIHGPCALNGTVKIGGSKNAALPILLSTLLTDEECVIHRVPDLRDIKTAFKLLEHLGKTVSYDGSTAVVKPFKKLDTAAPYDLVKQMRASVLVAGPLLARFNTARVPLPGGCAIGLRPVDIHIKGFEKLGATVQTERGDMVISSAQLSGNFIHLDFPSVGATENLMMCAVLVPGETVLENIAMEPEIEDLANFLRGMGAHISHDGPQKLVIEGVNILHGVEHMVIPDRIETGTYLIAGAAAGGKIKVSDCRPDHLTALIEALKESGALVVAGNDFITVEANPKSRPHGVKIITVPYPGFPTDLQAQWMAYMCLCEGTAIIKEEIFENRFMHAPELARMGAVITVEGNTAVVEGVKELTGANVMASDLRGGAALTVAALCARGDSEVARVYHIDRGYESMEAKFTLLGAKIERCADKT